jgi:Transglycosylase SLT domain
MPSRAEIIDEYFEELNAYPDIPYQPVGEILVDECEKMGPEGIWVSTAAALLEQESGGKNVFGCDFGKRWTTEPPYCNVEVTRERVKLLISNFHQPPAGVGQNGVGVTQITTMALVEQAEKIGGAHLIRHQMRVGFRYLNDLITRFGWPEGAAAYNAGPGNLQSVMETYGASMAKREREWAARLEGASDAAKASEEPAEDHNESPDGVSLVPAGFVPLAPRPGNYQDRHPTRYEWRENVEAVIRRLYKRFGRAIHVNTYVQHPGDENGRWARDTAAFDVWGKDGRNDFLPSALGDDVYDFLFTDPNEPDIDWIIYKRKIWRRATWSSGPWGSDKFTWHDDHIHVTYTGPFKILD